MASGSTLTTLVLILSCLSLFVPLPLVTSQPSPSPSPSLSVSPSSPPPPPSPELQPPTPPPISEAPTPAPSPSSDAPIVPPPDVGICVGRLGTPLLTRACCQVLSPLPADVSSGPLCALIRSRLEIPLTNVNKLVTLKVRILYKKCRVSTPTGFTCPLA